MKTPYTKMNLGFIVLSKLSKGCGYYAITIEYNNIKYYTNYIRNGNCIKIASCNKVVATLTITKLLTYYEWLNLACVLILRALYPILFVDYTITEDSHNFIATQGKAFNRKLKIMLDKY